MYSSMLGLYVQLELVAYANYAWMYMINYSGSNYMVHFSEERLCSKNGQFGQI